MFPLGHFIIVLFHKRSLLLGLAIPVVTNSFAFLECQKINIVIVGLIVEIPFIIGPPKLHTKLTVLIEIVEYCCDFGLHCFVPSFGV